MDAVAAQRTTTVTGLLAAARAARGDGTALYYDGQGVPWVYTISGPLTFERKRIEVERIDGDSVILKDGPSVGTLVVTVVAPQLFGAEVIFKR